MKTIAFFVGLLAVTLYLLGYQQKTKKRIIFLNASSRVMYILQYLLLGAWEGAALDIAGIVSAVLADRKDTRVLKKHTALLIIGTNGLIILMGLLTYQDATSLLAIAGVMLHTSAFWTSNEKWVRLVSLLGCPFWLAYNFVNGAYGSCIGDALSIASLVIAMYRYDWKK